MSTVDDSYLDVIDRLTRERDEARRERDELQAALTELRTAERPPAELWRVKVGGQARQDFANAWEADEYAAYLRDEEKLPARVWRVRRVAAAFDVEERTGAFTDLDDFLGAMEDVLQAAFADLEAPGVDDGVLAGYTFPDGGDPTVWACLADAAEEDPR